LTRYTSALKPYYKGLLAEVVVLLRYLLRGYIPLAFRWRARGIGEVDLIVYRFGTLAFVEVKARSICTHDLIHPKQVSRIRKASLHFLSKFPKYWSCKARIDFVFVNKFFLPKVVENAWFY
jgi:putative endonuclease